MEENTLIKYLIGASRIKYEVLDQLYAPYNMKQYRMVVMYVDAHSIFYRLYREKNFANMYAEGREDIIRDLVIGFFNVLGHYRRYMATRLHMDNDIFVTFNYNQPKYCAKNFPDYKNKLYHRYDEKDPDFGFINGALMEAWEFILGLSPYFEGIYCIGNVGVDDFAIMYRIGFKDDVFYTIFSRSLYPTQLLRKNVVQLYSKRDDSYLITEANCFEKGVLKDRKTTAHYKLTPDMLPLLWSLAGCPDVSMSHVKYVSGIASMIKTANAMCALGELTPGMSIQSFLDTIKGQIKSDRLQSKDERSKIEARYKVLSIPLLSAAITKDEEVKIQSMCYDLYDENELERLNVILAESSVDPELLEIGNLNMSEGVKYD